MKRKNGMHKYYVIRNAAFAVSAFIVLTPLIFYFCKFSNQSNDQEKWGQFGDFMNVWVSSASLIILGALTYYLNALDSYRQEEQNAKDILRQQESWDLENSRQEANRIIEDARNRPYVIYKYDIFLKVWKIKNVGIGPALNIRVSFKGLDDNWIMPVKIHSLAAGEETGFPFDKPTNNSRLCIVYNDIQKTSITTYGENEDSEIFIGVNCLAEYGPESFSSTHLVDQFFKNSGNQC